MLVELDDHEVVAVENHGERQEDEYDPCVGGNARTVNDFGNSKLFTVHQSLLKSIFSIRRNEYSGKPPAFPTSEKANLNQLESGPQKNRFEPIATRLPAALLAVLPAHLADDDWLSLANAIHAISAIAIATARTTREFVER